MNEGKNRNKHEAWFVQQLKEKDAIIDGQNWFLLEPENAAGYVAQINNYQPNKKLRRQVRDVTLGRFEWTGVAKQYYQAFQQHISQ